MKASSPTIEKAFFDLVKPEEDDNSELFEDLIRELIVADQEDIRRFKDLINTDDNQFLQYAAGRLFWQKVHCDDLSDVVNSKETMKKHLN